MSRYIPGRWNLLRLRLINRGDAPETVQSIAIAGDDAAAQFGRLVWLPPHSALETSYPIRIPATIDSKQRAIDLRTQTSRAGGANEVLVRDDWGKLEGSDLLQLTEPRAVTGIVCPLGAPPEEQEYDQVQELVNTSRRTSVLPLPVHEMGDAFLPAVVEGYRAFDQLIIADSRAGLDDAAVTAIRLWLESGRRMWLMLDQIDAVAVQRLLGESCQITEIDRVGLTTVALQWKDPNDQVEAATADYEQPVTFVRVLPGNAEVIATVDGWPAAFWLNFGTGRILVTTLGARGWLDKPLNQPPQLISPAATFTSQFFVPDSPQRPIPEALESVVQEYVGYAIPERRLVTGLLGGVSALLVIMALGLWCCGRIEQFGVYGPVISLIVGSVLVGIGLRQRQSVAPACVQLQIAEVLPDGSSARLRGVAGVYLPDSRPAVLEGAHGGWLTPDTTGLAGVPRLLWDDVNRWRWENLQQPAGLRVAEFESSSQFPQPFRVSATCGPDGLRGQIHAPDGMRPDEAVVVTANGRIGATLSADGTFTADSAAVFSARQFVAAEVLSDEQRRHARVLEALLTNPAWIGYPNEPMLAFWTLPLDGGLRFSPDLKVQGSALVFAPLNLNRPESGREFVIPAPLITFREHRGPDGSVPQGLYDYRTRNWQDRSGQSAGWLQYQLPPEFGALQLRSIRVVIRVAGPLGRLELAGWQDKRRTLLQSWNAPVGTLTADIKDVASLPVSPDGSFLIQLIAGEPVTPDAIEKGDVQREYWRIESLSLTVRAVRLPVESDTSSPPREAG